MFCRPVVRQNLPPPPPLHTAHPINFHLMNRPSKKNSTRIALTPPRCCAQPPATNLCTRRRRRRALRRTHPLSTPTHAVGAIRHCCARPKHNRSHRWSIKHCVRRFSSRGTQNPRPQLLSLSLPPLHSDVPIE
jgi:hypothetical protein